jgi:hypothetical protein
VLRDWHGKVRRVAKSTEEQKELRRWYEQYNKTTKSQDLPVSPKLRKKIALTVNDLMKRGFKYRQLIYGTRLNEKTDKWEYKRMEVFKGTPWTQKERQRIWVFFKWNIPKDNIGIYVIHNKKMLKRRLISSK